MSTGVDVVILLPILFGVVVMCVCLHGLKKVRERDAKERARMRQFMISKGFRSAPWWL